VKSRDSFALIHSWLIAAWTLVMPRISLEIVSCGGLRLIAVIGRTHIATENNLHNYYCGSFTIYCSICTKLAVGLKSEIHEIHEIQSLSRNPLSN